MRKNATLSIKTERVAGFGTRVHSYPDAIFLGTPDIKRKQYFLRSMKLGHPIRYRTSTTAA